MELNKIIETLNAKQKGTFIRIGYESRIESAKARSQGIMVTKKTITTVRWGCKYDNLKKVKEMHKLSPESNTQKRAPWFKHINNAPYLIEHISDSNKKYLQLFTLARKNLTKTEYYINGQKCDKQTVVNSGYVNPSAISSDDEKLIMHIPINNIQFIGKEV
jgi:hypothetical protein